MARRGLRRKDGSPTRRLGLTVSADLYEALRRVAEADGIAPSTLAVVCLEKRKRLARKAGLASGREHVN